MQVGRKDMFMLLQKLKLVCVFVLKGIRFEDRKAI